MPALKTVCSTCRAELNARDECLVCMLRGGLGAAGVQGPGAELPRVFGDFEIDRRDDGSPWELGCGAMGVTYRARDHVLNRVVALKVVVIPESLGELPAVRERFLRGARGAASLHHPNVAEVFQLGTSPETAHAYYAMELIDGETLEERVRRDGPLRVETALDIATQVANALVAAADRGLVHRDLKPGNIMLTDKTFPGALRVKVIDFGLAKAVVGVEDGTRLTHGGFLGTPAFASPEQFRGDPADARSDIYSLGATLWYALTGKVPYPGKTIEEISRCQTTDALPEWQLTARKVPACVIVLLRRALSIHLAVRTQSARELLTMLERCRVALEAVPRRRRWLVSVAVVLGLLGVGITAARQNLRNHPAVSAAGHLGGDGKKRTTNGQTNNPAAYDAYVRGMAIKGHDILTGKYDTEANAAFSEAIRIDPTFTLAWAELSVMHSDAYWARTDDGLEHLKMAKEALDAAMRLDPELGEVCMARGDYNYHCLGKLPEALQDFTEAIERLPNNAGAFAYRSFVERRLNRWDAALADITQAAQVDPSHTAWFVAWANTNHLMKHFADERANLDRAAMLDSARAAYVTVRKGLSFQMEGDVNAAAKLLDPLPLLPVGVDFFDTQINQWLYDGRYQRVIETCRILLARDPSMANHSRGLLMADLGWAQSLSGDREAASKSLQEARVFCEQRCVTRPDDYELWGTLAFVCACLGDRAAALQAGERTPPTLWQDAVEMTKAEARLARVHALLGDADGALQNLPRLLQSPGSDLTVGLLRIDPAWDPIRHDPRVQQLTAMSAKSQN